MAELIFLKEQQKISFSCQKCGRCCQNSRIRLSPYDLLKLCAALQISTMEFHQKYSSFVLDAENGNLLTCLLKTSPKCSFLGEKGCTVYSDRPLGCRTYPLAAQPFFDGQKFENDFYLLEECSGFAAEQEITLEEFQVKQGLKGEFPFYEAWSKFKVIALNSNLPHTEEYRRKFLALCYDFDNSFFQSILRKNNIELPSKLEEKYHLILNIAKKILLDPYGG